MTLRIDSFNHAYRIAHAAGWDEANRRRARDSRDYWDAEDWDQAAAIFRRVMAALGFAEPGSPREGDSDMVSTMNGRVSQPRSAPHGQPAVSCASTFALTASTNPPRK
jgi:hypothetical protein